MKKTRLQKELIQAGKELRLIEEGKLIPKNADDFIKEMQAKHGGKRAGSGRKPLDPDGAVKLVVAVPASLLERLDAVAEQQGWNRSEAVREAVQALVKRK